MLISLKDCESYACVERRVRQFIEHQVIASIPPHQSSVQTVAPADGFVTLDEYLVTLAGEVDHIVENLMVSIRNQYPGRHETL